MCTRTIFIVHLLTDIAKSYYKSNDCPSNDFITYDILYSPIECKCDDSRENIEKKISDFLLKVNDKVLEISSICISVLLLVGYNDDHCENINIAGRYFIDTLPVELQTSCTVYIFEVEDEVNFTLDPQYKGKTMYVQYRENTTGAVHYTDNTKVFVTDNISPLYFNLFIGVNN